MDSNGKFIDPAKLFPGQTVRATRCRNTARALELLDRGTLGSPRCIVIHTGTNDLSSLQHNTARAVRRVAEKASQEFPDARVVISTLLPRADTPPHVIFSINAEIARGCAALPNVHLAHHPTLRPWHMYDGLHLDRENVGAFAKTLKDAALGRNPTSPPRNNTGRILPRMPPRNTPMQQLQTPARPHNTTRPRARPASPGPQPHPQQHSYAAALARPPPKGPHSYAAALAQPPPPPATSELSEIKQLLNTLCSRLLH